MTKKCAHPMCSCQAPAEKSYCSEQCATAKPGDAKCPCEHTGCKAH